MTLNCIFLVGRPGLDPGTLGLKVLVKALRHVASSRTASQNCRWKPQFDGLIDTGWNEVRRTATHLLGPPGPDVADAFLDSNRARLQRVASRIRTALI